MAGVDYTEDWFQRIVDVHFPSGILLLVFNAEDRGRKENAPFPAFSVEIDGVTINPLKKGSIARKRVPAVDPITPDMLKYLKAWVREDASAPGDSNRLNTMFINLAKVTSKDGKKEIKIKLPPLEAPYGEDWPYYDLLVSTGTHTYLNSQGYMRSDQSALAAYNFALQQAAEDHATLAFSYATKNYTVYYNSQRWISDGGSPAAWVPDGSPVPSQDSVLSAIAGHVPADLYPKGNTPIQAFFATFLGNPIHIPPPPPLPVGFQIFTSEVTSVGPAPTQHNVLSPQFFLGVTALLYPSKRKNYPLSEDQLPTWDTSDAQSQADDFFVWDGPTPAGSALVDVEKKVVSITPP